MFVGMYIYVCLVPLFTIPIWINGQHGRYSRVLLVRVGGLFNVICIGKSIKKKKLWNVKGFEFRWPTKVIQLRNTDLSDLSSYLTPLHLLFESPEWFAHRLAVDWKRHKKWAGQKKYKSRENKKAFQKRHSNQALRLLFNHVKRPANRNNPMPTSASDRSLGENGTSDELGRSPLHRSNTKQLKFTSQPGVRCQVIRHGSEWSGNCSPQAVSRTAPWLCSSHKNRIQMP